jgi:hypothetical protein
MMSAPRPATLADRLVKLCGMLGSAHDGERAAAAALKADQPLRRHGLRWPDVIRIPALPAATSPPGRIWRQPKYINRYAADYLVSCWPEVLTDWERAFCRQLGGQKRISRKQWIILRRLVDKCCRFAEGPGAD